MIHEECSICLEKIKPNIKTLVSTLICNHKFHEDCINKLKKSNCPSKNNCPLCRNLFNLELNNNNNNNNNNNDNNINNNINNIPLPIVQLMLFSSIFNTPEYNTFL